MKEALDQIGINKKNGRLKYNNSKEKESNFFQEEGQSLILENRNAADSIKLGEDVVNQTCFQVSDYVLGMKE